MNISISGYYKAFGRLAGLLAAVPLLPPLLGVYGLEPGKFSEYLYPPLGDIQRLAFSATIAILLLLTLGVYVLCERSPAAEGGTFFLLLLAAAAGVCFLIVLYVKYVRLIPVESVGVEVPISVGGQRSEFARTHFPGLTDLEMLHRRGPWEDKIQQLWTPGSIATARVLLWVTYTGTLGSLLAAFCFGIYRDASRASKGLGGPILRSRSTEPRP